MKIGILTHYDVNNQGAQLQMYSTYNKIKELGHEPVILTYNKNYDFKPSEKNKNQVSIKSIPYLINNYLFKKGIGLTLHNAKKYNSNKKFRINNFSFEDYANADIDMAVVGSDEVLSLEMGVNLMMYGHGVSTSNMISYAPSFGQTDVKKIEEHNCRNLISSGLSDFKDISARDENTAKIIKELTGRDSTIVCDPVLLYDFKNTRVPMELPKEKYLIVYAYDRHMIDDKEVRAIQTYAKKNNLITVSAGNYHGWCDLNIVCDCLEWVELFRGAEAVVTDTYHGTIVSAITNTPMAIFVRDKINANKLTHLVNRLDLNDRQMNDFTAEELEEVFTNQLDFDKLNSLILNFRNTSESYLINAIENIKLL